jgi:hypothetical protein
MYQRTSHKITQAAHALAHEISDVAHLRHRRKRQSDLSEQKLSWVTKCRLNTTHHPCCYTIRTCQRTHFLSLFVGKKDTTYLWLPYSWSHSCFAFVFRLCILFHACCSPSMFLPARELFESGVQLLGLYQIMMISDIDRVFVLATVFSLNLIVLPLVAWLAEFQSGPVFAKGVCVLLEVLFDKAFAIAGVGETVFVVLWLYCMYVCTMQYFDQLLLPIKEMKKTKLVQLCHPFADALCFTICLRFIVSPVAQQSLTNHMCHSSPCTGCVSFKHSRRHECLGGSTNFTPFAHVAAGRSVCRGQINPLHFHCRKF